MGINNTKATFLIHFSSKKKTVMRGNKILSALLAIMTLLISCEKEAYDPLAHDGNVFTNEQLLGQLFTYPDSIIYNSEVYKLECDVYRNFSPIPICGNGPIPDSIPRFLEVALTLVNDDSSNIGESLFLTEIFVVHNTEIWQPEHHFDTTLIDNLFYIIRGPQWDTDDIVSVMCNFKDNEENIIKLKQENLTIRRID